MVLNRAALRLLDVDDFLVILWIGEGRSLTEVAHSLGLTTPAIVHRVRKMEGVFGENITLRGKAGRVTPTDKCIALAKVSKEIISQMNSFG